jgi:hypothetical protein
MVNSVMEGKSPGLYLDRLILDYCNAWKMPASNRPRKGEPAGQASPGALVETEDRRTEGPGVNPDGPDIAA